MLSSETQEQRAGLPSTGVTYQVRESGHFKMCLSFLAYKMGLIIVVTLLVLATKMSST